MTIYTGDDATAGSEVHWYFGGTQASESKTVSSGDASAGYIALAAKAEQGSVIITVNGAVTGCVGYSDASGNTIATDTSGVLSIKYTDITNGQVLAISYLDISTSTLSEVAMCQDVSTSWDISEISEDVHGQVNQVKKTGTTNQTADLKSLDYTSDFLAGFFGDTTTDASGNKLYTTRYTGSKKVGAIVGKRQTTAGVINKKYFMYGAQCTKLGKDFPANGMYADSLTITVDEYSEWEAV